MAEFKKRAGGSPTSVLGPSLDLQICAPQHTSGFGSFGAFPKGRPTRQHRATDEYCSGPVLNPNAGCWQPPSPVLVIPMSPAGLRRHDCDASAAFSQSPFGWHWQTPPLLEPSPEPTRTVLVLTTGGPLSEQQVMQCAGGAQAVRAITAMDTQGSCTAVSFYDLRSAAAFHDRVCKVSTVLQAFCISPLLSSPDQENQGALLVKLGAPTGAAQPARPTHEAVLEAAQAFGFVNEVWEDSGNEEGLWWRVHFADTQDAEAAKQGLEGLEIAQRAAHIEYLRPPAAACAPVSPGWARAFVPPGSPQAAYTLFGQPAPSYAGFTPISSDASRPASTEYMGGSYGMAPCSGDYGGDYSADFSQLTLGGACLAPLSWSPYGAYPMYPGMGMMLDGSAASPAASPMCSGSPYGPSCFLETLYPEHLYPEMAYPDFRAAAARSPRSGRGSRAGRQPEFDTLEYAFDPEEGRKRGAAARTTLMIRNIPNKYTQAMLLDILEDVCSAKYDFFYLPIDYKNKCNLGYAFVNFTDTDAAAAFFEARHQQRWVEFNSKKVCEITYARVQGRQSLVDHFRNSKFGATEQESLPLVFEPARDAQDAESRVAVPITKLCGSRASVPSTSAARH